MELHSTVLIKVNTCKVNYLNLLKMDYLRLT